MMFDKIPHPKKRAFLAAYIECCQISGAAKAADVDRGSHYDWMESDAEYKATFERARAIAGDTLEDEAIRRAREGVEKPVTIAGEREVIREYSDTLLIFLLKGAKPDKYRERATIAHTDPDGKPLLDIASVRAYMQTVADSDTLP